MQGTRRDILKATSLLAVASALPQIGGAAAQTKRRFGLIAGDVGNPFHTRVWKTAKATAAANDVDLLILDSKRDLATESSNIDQLIAEKVDFVMVMAGSAEGSLAGLDRLADAKIPFMTMLDTVNGAGEKYRYVGSDFEPWGKIQADKLAQIAKGNLVYIKGGAAALVEHNRDRQFKEAMKSHPDLHIVFEQFGDWNKPSGVTLMEDAITRSPAPNSIQAVMAHNDNMALGAIEALKRANRLSEVVVGGSDGNADALESMVAGELAYTTFQDGETIGRTAVLTAVDILNGKNPPMLVGVPWVMIDTKALAAKYLKQVYGKG